MFDPKIFRLGVSGLTVLGLIAALIVALIRGNDATIVAMLAAIGLSIQNLLNQFPTEKGAKDAEDAKHEAAKAKNAVVAVAHATDALNDTLDRQSAEAPPKVNVVIVKPNNGGETP